MTLLHNRFRGVLLGAAAFLTLGLATSQACTSLLVKTSDDGYVYGRTMEFGFELKSKVVVAPRGISYTSTAADGQKGLAWTGKYAFVGMNGLDKPILADGMNEKGLVGGIFYFPGYAEYTPPKDADPAQSMAPWEFVSWAVANFATVDEIKAAVENVRVIGLEFPGAGFVPPFHYSFHDASGKSIVIEPTGGELKVFDNPFGVLTNSPTFDWHLTNLGNYVKLSPDNVDSLKVNGQTIPSFGQGSGWLGIPGDPTPPSRFIRAIAFSMTVDPEPNGIKSVRLVEHIMNNFDIPFGTIRPAKGDECDYTQWTTVADIGTGTYYVKTYNNQTLQAIALENFDPNAKTVSYAPIEDAEQTPFLAFPKK